MSSFGLNSLRSCPRVSVSFWKGITGLGAEDFSLTTLENERCLSMAAVPSFALGFASGEEEQETQIHSSKKASSPNFNYSSFFPFFFNFSKLFCDKSCIIATSHLSNRDTFECFHFARSFQRS